MAAAVPVRTSLFIALALVLGLGVHFLTDDVEPAATQLVEFLDSTASEVDAAVPLAEPVSPPVATDAAVTPIEIPSIVSSEEATPRNDVLTGIISRLSDGSPLSDWYVSTRPGTAVKSQLGSDGSFHLEGVSPDTTTLELEKTRSWTGYPGLINRNSDGYATVTLPEQAFERSLKLSADTGWQVSGSLVSGAGGVPPGAWVESGSPYSAKRHQVDSNGAFDLRDLRPDGEESVITLRAGAPMHTTVSSVVELPEATRRVTGLEWQLPATAGALEGRVVDAEGRAVPLMTVSLVSVEGGEWNPDIHVMPEQNSSLFGSDYLALRGTPLDDDPEVRAFALRPDQFRLDGIPPGRYDLSVDPANLAFGLTMSFFDPGPEGGPTEDERLELYRQALHAVAQGPPVPVEIRVGEVSRVELHLPWGAALEGRVTDDAGAPIPNAQLQLHRSYRAPAPPDETLESLNATLITLTQKAEARGEQVLLPPFVVEQTKAGLVLRLKQFVGYAKSDVEGWFQVGQLSPGEVVLEVHAPKNSSFAGAVQSLTLHEGLLSEVNVALQRR